jgi:hypothetical protein
MRYIEPGAPTPPPLAPQPNAYVAPRPTLQEAPIRLPQPTPRAAPEPQPPPEPPQARDQDDSHQTTALFTEWHAHHGSDWVKACELHPAVRRLIDARGRISAARQKLPLLVATCREMETKVMGNAAKRVMVYRLIQSETANPPQPRRGLEGSAGLEG